MSKDWKKVGGTFFLRRLGNSAACGRWQSLQLPVLTGPWRLVEARTGPMATMVRPAAVLRALVWQVRQTLSVRALSSAGWAEAWASWQLTQLPEVTAPWTCLA